MEKYLSVLKNSTLFNGLSDDEILSSLHCADVKVRTVGKNQYILQTGDTTGDIGLLLTGAAFVLQEDLWGNRNIMTSLFPGDTFAEPFAVIPDTALNVSVITTEDCEIMSINAKRLLTMCSSACEYHNRLIQNLVASFAKKTLQFNDKITHISKRKTRDKLLSYLSAEALQQNSLTFDIPFDRQQLADYLCVERAAMSVELSKLQKEGYLKTSRAHFELNEKMVEDFRF